MDSIFLLLWILFFAALPVILVFGFIGAKANSPSHESLNGPIESDSSEIVTLVESRANKKWSVFSKALAFAVILAATQSIYNGSLLNLLNGMLRALLEMAALIAGTVIRIGFGG